MLKILNKTLLILCFILSINIITFADSLDFSNFNGATITPPIHTHVFIDSYDDTYHFKKCSVCGTIQTGTKIAHNKSIILDKPIYSRCDTHHGQAIYELCSNCNYRKNLPLDPHDLNTSISTNTDPFQYQHYVQCKNCPGGTSERCTKSDGSLITCQNLGVCSKCGYDYATNNAGHIAGASYSPDGGASIIWKCQLCNQDYIKVSNFTQEHVKGTHKYVVSRTYEPVKSTDVFEFVNAGRKINRFWSGAGTIWDTDPTKSYTEVIENIPGKKYTIKATLEIIDPKTIGLNNQGYSILTIYDHWNLKDFKINGVFCEFPTGNSAIPVYYDEEAPQVKSESITVTDIQKDANNEWIIKQKFHITGTDNLSEYVDIDIKNNGTSLLSAPYRLPVDLTTRRFSTSIDGITPMVETSSGILTFTITDLCGNVTTINKNVGKSDNYAPNINGSTDYTTPWTKSKTINMSAKDDGSGQVKFFLGDRNNSYTSTKTGDNYTKSVEVTGDIYTEIKPQIWAEDEILNLSNGKEISINKIDNTSPTVVNAQQDPTLLETTKIQINSNDLHATKGEGSGVKKYKIKRIQ